MGGDQTPVLRQEEKYRRLTILDGKCAALLQLSALILAIGAVVVPGVHVTGFLYLVTIAIGIIFLIISLLSLSVIWVNWEPSVRLLERRTTAYKACVVMTGVGLVLIAVFIFVTPFR